MQEKKFMPYKFIFKNAYIPIWMGFGGILIECLLIVLYGLVPAFFAIWLYLTPHWYCQGHFVAQNLFFERQYINSDFA